MWFGGEEAAPRESASTQFGKAEEALRAAETAVETYASAARDAAADAVEDGSGSLRDEAVDAIGNEGDLPIVPFTEHLPHWVHGYKESDTLPQACKFPGCKFLGKSWLRLCIHVRKDHGVKASQLENSYLDNAAKPERNTAQQTLRRTRAAAKKAEKEQNATTVGKGKGTRGKKAREASSTKTDTAKTRDDIGKQAGKGRVRKTHLKEKQDKISKKERKEKQAKRSEPVDPREQQIDDDEILRELFSDEDVAVTRKASAVSSEAQASPPLPTQSSDPASRLQDRLLTMADEALAKGDTAAFESLFDRAKQMMELRRGLCVGPFESQRASASGSLPSAADHASACGFQQAAAPANQQPCPALLPKAMAIKKDVPKWVDTKEKDRMNRQRGTYREFPWETDKATNISEWKLDLFSKVTNEGSRAFYVSGLQQFLSLFDTNGATLQQVFEQLAGNELLPQALNYPMLAADISWTSKMMSASHRVCVFIRSRATRRGDTALANKMSLLIEDFIDPRLELCSKAKKEALAERDEGDYDWLSQMNADAMKAAVKDMQKDLATAAYASKEGMPGQWRKFATVCMTGITFFAQCNSRPGPWRHLTAETIHDMREKGKDYWTAVKGVKLLAVRGAHGSYMSPGCISAAEVYMSMASGEDPSFWLYKCPKLDAWLKEACTVYLPGYPEMSPTAVRQFWETVMHHDEGEISKKIAKAQAAMNNAMDHEDSCAKANYKKGKAKKVAADSKACTMGFYDGLITWPADELTDAFLAGNCGAVPAKFAAAITRAQRKGATGADALEDAEGDSATNEGQDDNEKQECDDVDEEEEIEITLAAKDDADASSDDEAVSERLGEPRINLEDALEHVIDELANSQIGPQLSNSGQSAGTPQAPATPSAAIETPLHASAAIGASEDETVPAAVGDATSHGIASAHDCGAGTKRCRLPRTLRRSMTRAETPTPTLARTRNKCARDTRDSQEKPADHGGDEPKEPTTAAASSDYVGVELPERDLDSIRKTTLASPRAPKGSMAFMRKEPTRITAEGQKWILARHLNEIEDTYPWTLKPKQWFEQLRQEGITLEKLPQDVTLSGVYSVAVRWKNDRIKRFEQRMTESAAREKGRAANEAMEAAFTSWGISAAQITASKAECFVASYADRNTTAKDLRALVEDVPKAALQGVGLDKFAERVASMRRLPEKAAIHKDLQTLIELCNMAKAFLERKLSTGVAPSASASSAPTAAPNAD